MSKSDSAFWIMLALLVTLAGASIFLVPDKNLERVNISVQTVLVGGLVLFTGFYAWRTSAIAKATLELAQETCRQRQDAFLPVLDIIDASKGEEGVAIGLDLMAGKIPNDLRCTMKNVGVGPALHVQYQSRGPDGIISLLTENSLIQGCEFTPPGKLAIVSSANPPYIQVTYRDVFGRECTSRKDILADFTQNAFELGPLEFKVQ